MISNDVSWGENVTVECGAIIHPNCVICDNVTIGVGAVVNSGSVVKSSIPPHGIVEGNPARLVGFNITHKPIHASDFNDFINKQNIRNGKTAGAKQLKVGGSVLHRTKVFNEQRGSLSVGEFPLEIPFIPKRYFIVSGVPKGEIRGLHAHKTCEQYLLCISGSCNVFIDDGYNNKQEIILDTTQVGLYVPAMVWGTQYYQSDDTVLLVLASDTYDADDYIHNYQEFISR